MSNWKAFRLWIFLWSLALFLSVACMGTGCSKGLLGKGSKAWETWTCDNDADEAMKRRDYETAIVLHERFLKKQPENALALYHLGYAHGQTGDHMKEVSYYEKAVAIGFKSENIFFNMGMAYGELDEIIKAIRTFKQGIDIYPDSANNHLGLAMAYQRDGNDKRAEKEFLKVIKINPEHVEARLFLSMLYMDLGERQRAAEQLRKILKKDPHNVRVRKFLERIERE